MSYCMQYKYKYKDDDILSFSPKTNKIDLNSITYTNHNFQNWKFKSKENNLPLYQFQGDISVKTRY